MTKGSEIDIGYVVEVNGERALVDVTADTTEPLVGDYYPGQPGSHVKIPHRDHSVIGIVSSIAMDGRGKAPDDGAPAGRRLAECILIGTLDACGRFGRGVAVYPNVGQRVQLVTSEELKGVFSEYVDYGFSFGRPAQAPDQRCYVNVDRFFGQHVAVLGTTGCGKSCTVVSMLQEAIRRYPDTHIVVLDLHGEYGTAFPEDALLIDADRVELPYWLLNFDEFQDLLIDPAEFTAKNQVTVLRDALVRAREGSVGEEKTKRVAAVTADSPVWFNVEDLLEQIRHWNIQMVPNAKGELEPGPLYGVFDRFLIRFDSMVSDPRFRFMFAPSSYADSDGFARLLRDYLSIDTGKRIAIVDLSGVPSEAVGVVVAVVSRMVFEFNLWNPERERFPILLVLEEAHNYVPNRDTGRFTAARTAIERIAKEGRKYGTGMIIVSQRPKELSETVISQCNNFVVMRLTNPDDQGYVRKLVTDALAGLMNMLPSLRTGEALLLGDAVALPTRTLVQCPEPKPMSSDVEFARWWSDGIKELDVDRIVKRWRARRRDL